MPVDKKTTKRKVGRPKGSKNKKKGAKKQAGKGAKSFFKKVGRTLKKGNDYLRKKKLVSKGLNLGSTLAMASGNPTLAGKLKVGSKVSKQLGYGLHPAGKGLSVAGGSLRRAGARKGPMMKPCLCR